MECVCVCVRVRGGVVRLKLGVQGQGSGRILDVDVQGELGVLKIGQLENFHDAICLSSLMKSSKLEQDKKTLMSAFPFFYTAIARVLFLEKRLDTRLYLHPNLKFF